MYIITRVEAQHNSWDMLGLKKWKRLYTKVIVTFHCHELGRSHETIIEGSIHALFASFQRESMTVIFNSHSGKSWTLFHYCQFLEIYLAYLFRTSFCLVLCYALRWSLNITPCRHLCQSSQIGLVEEGSSPINLNRGLWRPCRWFPTSGGSIPQQWFLFSLCGQIVVGYVVKLWHLETQTANPVVPQHLDSIRTITAPAWWDKY